jgi:predicted dehydrogenase
MYDLHIHDVDFVNYLLGAPARIQASSRRAKPGSGCEIIHALFSYQGGAQVSISGGWAEVQIPFKAGYEAWFEKGFVRQDTDKTPSLSVFDGPDRQVEHPAQYIPGDAYLNEIKYFLDCIKNNQDMLECPPESARDSLALLVRERSAIESLEAK